MNTEERVSTRVPITRQRNYLQSKKFDELVQVLLVLGAEIGVHCTWKSETQNRRRNKTFTLGSWDLEQLLQNFGPRDGV